MLSKEMETIEKVLHDIDRALKQGRFTVIDLKFLEQAFEIMLKGVCNAKKIEQ